jgi:prepilin-type N-terminal cleavage/methylation domain-containing protein
MIEITTSNSTNVNESLFAFGNLRDEVKVITMTTPALFSFHQNKNTSHPAPARSAQVATDFSHSKTNPFFALRDNSLPSFIPPILNPFSARRLTMAFTLIELLAVITIIGILAGLTLGAAGAVRRHGANSTAKSQVAALQAACDRYYADNNLYPSDTSVDPSSSFSPTAYTNACQTLFTNLVGSVKLSLAPTSKRYFEPNPSMVYTNGSPNHFVDPWGYAYGYNSDGTNAPLIWSTAGQTLSGGTNKWVTSWPKM